MENKKVVKALLLISEGFSTLAEALGDENSIPVPTIAPTNVVHEVKEIKAVTSTPKTVVPEVEPVVEKEAVANLDVTDLEAMPYNELKKLAKDMRVSAKGTKQELVERLSSIPVEFDEEEEEEEVELEEELEEDEEEDEEEEEEEEETLEDKIERELRDYSLEELVDILTDIGVSPKGKRQALLAKIVKAVRDGLLSFEDEEEEEEEKVVEVPKSSKGKANKKAPEPVEEEDEEEEEEEVVITKARKKAMLEIAKEVKKMIKDGEISIKEIDEQLNEYFTPEEGYNSKLPKNEKIDMFIEMQQNLIDDEGEQRDPSDPYELNGELACCGKHLSDLDNGNAYCTVCGEEYSFED